MSQPSGQPKQRMLFGASLKEIVFVMGCSTALLGLTILGFFALILVMGLMDAY